MPPTKEEEELTKKQERKLSKIKFVIVEKESYKKFKELQKVREDTRSILFSDNLSDSRSMKLIKSVNKADNLLHLAINQN